MRHRASGAAARSWSRLKRRLAGPPRPWNGEMPFLDSALSAAMARGVVPLPARPRIVQLIGTLGPGGAERQLCNFVIGASRLGYDVRVILMWEPTGEAGHYYHLLKESGIDVRTAGSRFDPRFGPALERIPGGPACLEALPQECRVRVLDVLGELLIEPPDVLHAWLDGANVVAGIAGLLAQVPLVVLGARNVNPSNFPALSQPYYRRVYSILLESPPVRLITNSHAGADDYANWLDVPRRSVAVVLNGLGTTELRAPTPAQVTRFRHDAGIPPGVRVIAGVFRFAEEKQPLTFLEVLRGVVRDCPDAVAVLAGTGPLESQVRNYVVAHGLESHVSFVGRIFEPSCLYSTASVTLLCSRQEGTPNVLLEAQRLGCPVVATRAGGTIDAVDDGVTGYLCAVGDVPALQQAVLRLLRDDELRRGMALKGPGFIQSRFSVDRMVAETLALYGITL
jgi:glycosyltransferase involved in cell wall biosynthesis